MATAAHDYDFNVANGLTVVGSPASVVRQLQASQARLGYDVFCTNHVIGQMPPELVARSIELFGREVIPAFAS
jgi:alkanesulfonate monooxygenase SsuD/methylene tetrahydromethanopterin reductase-like flavin-dependent oxidoreductase (luciferase family)